MSRHPSQPRVAPAVLESALRARLRPDQWDLDPGRLLVYECDGHTVRKRPPLAVTFPESTRDVQEIVRLCRDHDLPFLPRGAGTGLSGGAVAHHGGVIIETARMKKILHIDPENRRAIVQPGVVNAHLSRAAAPYGLHYAPDPSSQGACTLGGNVAENSGGPHTLKYGVTTNHVLALEVVLPDGDLVHLGHPSGHAPGFDLRAAFIGSEGTFGIATEITVRLLPNARSVRTFLAIFDDLEDAGRAVSGILSAGVIPAAIELIDQAAIQAVEAHLAVGFPTDAAAVILIEFEGHESELAPLSHTIRRITGQYHCRELREAEDEATRRNLWKGRKQALGALGKIAKAYYTHDGVVPRSKLPEAIRQIRVIAEKHGLRVANVCHAGDGNLHPLLLFDPDDDDERNRMQEAGKEILRMCVDLGGALTGEHGVGMEKQSYMTWLFSEIDLDQFRRLRHVFDPDEYSNPHKIFPTGATCGETHALRARKTGGWL